MLIQLLQEIANSEDNSYATLARNLNLDQEMVKQMFYNLRSMGYIISDAPACGDDRCDECGICCTKKKKDHKEENPNTAITRWKLTEKGKKAAAINN